MPSPYTVPGMKAADSLKVVEALQERLVSLLDLQLTLKHVHWNVVGPQFIAVHEMLDPQVAEVRVMTDEMAERIATMGGAPMGTPAAIVEQRTWDDYGIGRETTQVHLAALDSVYEGIISDHRKVQAKLGALDAVSEDMVIGQIARLELFQWFVRAHLEDAAGSLTAGGAARAKAKARSKGSKKTTRKRS